MLALNYFWSQEVQVRWLLLAGIPSVLLSGLARGWGWQFYLIASFLHALTNYSVVLLQVGLFTVVHVEIYAAVIAGALWLRWRKTSELAEAEV